MNKMNRHTVLIGVVAAACLAYLAGCSTAPALTGQPRNEMIHAQTQEMDLSTINTGPPERILQRQASTRLYLVDLAAGQAQDLGTVAYGAQLLGISINL